MEKNQLKEIKKHGTAYFPCAFYYTENDFKDLIVKHHWHDQLELIYIDKGEFQVEIDMDKYMINEECICFINSEELHFIKSNHPCRESAIVFDLKMLSFELFDSIQGTIIQPLLNGELKMPHFIFKNEKYGEEILKEYHEILKAYKIDGQISQKPEGNITKNLYSQIKIKTSLLKILGMLYDNNLFIKYNHNNKDYRVEYIKIVITYIQNNYSEKIHIKDLAKQINMNEQYFCRFFKKMLGKTPMEYVNEYRIKKAKELLRESDRQVMEICLECGFHNMGNFIKVFKRYEGTSPNKYRKRFTDKKS